MLYVDDIRLLQPPGELRHVEPALTGARDEDSAVAILSDGNAEVSETGPLGLEHEIVDAREIRGQYPEIVGVAERARELDDAIPVEHCCPIRLSGSRSLAAVGGLSGGARRAGHRRP